MKPPLSKEQRQALDRQPEGIEVEDAETQKVYFLTDAELHRRAMQALKQGLEDGRISVRRVSALIGISVDELAELFREYSLEVPFDI